MKIALLALGATLVLAAQPALAIGVGYSLVIAGSTNVPTFTLTNDSDAAQITGFRFTVGRATGFNFDYVDNFAYAPVGSFTSAMTEGDGSNGGARTDAFAFSFTGFDPLEAFSLEADVDPDSSNQTVNYNTVFWNNGGGDNSEITVTFSTGATLSQVAPDPEALAASYTFAKSEGMAVPLPGSLPLLGGALALAGLLLRRRRG